MTSAKITNHEPSCGKTILQTVLFYEVYSYYSGSRGGDRKRNAMCNASFHNLSITHYMSPFQKKEMTGSYAEVTTNLIFNVCFAPWISKR